MHARKVLSVVFFLWSLTPPPESMPLRWKLQSCIYFYISFEQPLGFSQLNSTNGPTQTPPFVPHTGGAKSNDASDWRSRVERSSLTYRATQAPFFLFLQPRYEITPWHKASGRNCSTLLVPTRYAQGHSLQPSPEVGPQAICGNHDSWARWFT